MRLLKYKVNKFRSVKETEWIEIDQWTCFVGVNESGKTNLLLPLWKFNPADESTKVDLLLDYPRDEYSKIEENKGIRKTEPFIETLFELTEEEIQKISKKHAENIESSKDNEEETSEHNSENTKTLKLKKHIKISKDYIGNFYAFVSDEKCHEESDELEGILGDTLFKELLDLIPKFVYYSEYGNLDSDLYLPHVKDDLKNIKSLTGKKLMKARTLNILFGHLNLNPDEILSLGEESSAHQATEENIDKDSRKKQERHAKVTSAATSLSAQFKDWWSQGSYNFHFNADGLYFRIFVSDAERPSPIELESRSKGLQWFFSFFLVFLAESKGNHRDCILLLDEPGLSLHPNAQTDLIRFFNQLSENNQLIYTTHLPFLVDHNRLDRVKAVYTKNGLTKASNDISKADKEKKAIQPVNAAIGISASQSLLVGCDIVIVEGVSDQFYLTLIKNHLISKKKFSPKKELVFIPVDGAKGVKPVVSIIQGRNSELPIVLLDSDDAGKRFKNGLLQGLYKSEKGKILEIDTFTEKSGSEIEDLIPTSIIVDSFDRLYRSEEGLSEEDIDPTIPIIPQLESFAEDNHITLELGWKVDLSKKVKQKFKGQLDDQIENAWATLFSNLQ